jgi:hypothetical protein
MKATFFKSNENDKNLQPVVTDIDLKDEVKDERLILSSSDLGFKFSISNSGDIESINVIVSETNKTVIVNYSGAKSAIRCCVTCNGWEFCGESACCELYPAGSGNWLCC